MFVLIVFADLFEEQSRSFSKGLSELIEVKRKKK